MVLRDRGSGAGVTEESRGIGVASDNVELSDDDGEGDGLFVFAFALALRLAGLFAGVFLSSRFKFCFLTAVLAGFLDLLGFLRADVG